MKNLNKILSLALIAMLTFACSDDDDALDAQAPVIEVMEPAVNSEFEPGDMLHIHAEITDDVQLSSYRIDIHFGGDGHTHRPVANAEGEHMEWSYDETGTISGTAHSLEKDIEIPHHIMHDGVEHEIEAGDYHIGIFIIDATGNETELFRTIEVHNHAEGGGHDHG